MPARKPTAKNKPAKSKPSPADALHAAIDANPDDVASYQVLADYLLEHGDPRGELIHLESKPGKEGNRARSKLQEQLGPELAYDCKWKLGYVRHYFEHAGFEAADAIREKLAHPSLRHLTSIEIELEGSFQDRRQWVIDLIAEELRPALRSIRVRGNTPELTDLSLAKLWTKKLPRLEEVHVNARLLKLGDIESSTLAVLDIAAGIDDVDLKPLLTAKLPALRELKFEAEEDGARLAKLRASPLGKRLGKQLTIVPLDTDRYDRFVE